MKDKDYDGLRKEISNYISRLIVFCLLLESSFHCKANHIKSINEHEGDQNRGIIS